MGERYNSVRDYMTHRQHEQDTDEATQHEYMGTVTFHHRESEEEEVIIYELGPRVMAAIRRRDPFLYHSIENQISGNNVSNIRQRIQSDGPGDAAAGGITPTPATDRRNLSQPTDQSLRRSSSLPIMNATIVTSPNHVMQRSKSLPQMNILHTSYVVVRRRRLSTEVHTLEFDEDEMLEMMQAQAGELNNDVGNDRAGDLMDEIFAEVQLDISNQNSDEP